MKGHWVAGTDKLRVRRSSITYKAGDVVTSVQKVWRVTNLRDGWEYYGSDLEELKRQARAVYVPCSECGR